MLHTPRPAYNGAVRGLWLERGKLEVREIPDPRPAPGEALVRVLQAGICNTDLELVRGYYPFTGVLGHEFVGIVESGPEPFCGRRVVGEINASCGDCSMCRRGVPTHCERRTVLGIQGRNGAFAELLTLPADNLHVVAETISDDAATFTEPLAAALRIPEQVALEPGTRLLVVGTGKLGQLIARSLALLGCDVVALGRRTASVEILRALGISTAGPDEVADRSFDLAVECTGNPDGFELARRALRPRGRLVVKSTYSGSLTFDVSAIVVDEIELIGSRCGPFPAALEMLAGGRLGVADLVEARYPLTEAPAAFEHAARPGALKVLLAPGR